MRERERAKVRKSEWRNIRSICTRTVMISIVAHHSYPSSWPVPIGAYVTCGRCTLRAVLESQPDPAGPCRRPAQ